MIDVVEEPDHIDINEPFYTRPAVLDLIQRGMAGSATPEAVRMNAENRFIHDFQQQLHHALNELVIGGRHTQRALLSVGLGNINPADRGKSVIPALIRAMRFSTRSNEKPSSVLFVTPRVSAPLLDAISA